MNIYEYQAKRIFKKFGINIPTGAIAYTPNEAKEAALKVSENGPWVVKAQIKAGSRGHGIFSDKRAGKKGGIRVSKTLENVFDDANAMLDNELITDQTNHKGRIVSRVYVEEYIKVIKKFYFGIAVDRMVGTAVLLVFEVDKKSGEYDLHNTIKLDLGIEQKISDSNVLKILDFMNTNIDKRELKTFINKMLKIFYDYDAHLLEINPIGITTHGEIYALDAKIIFDQNALYRHPDITHINTEAEASKSEYIASKFGFQYRELDNGIGIIVNGDGIAASTITGAKKLGMNTACFLNIKGGIDREKITASIKLIITNPRVDGIFINILGGFSRCNLIADGIINVSNDLGLNIPLVIRFEGTNKQEATDILQKSNLPLSIVNDTKEGLQILKKAIEEDI